MELQKVNKHWGFASNIVILFLSQIFCISGGISVSSASQAASQAQKDGAGSDRVLADFFQQLLKKSSTQPNSPSPSGGTPQDNSSTPLAKKPTTLNTSPLANMLNKNKK